MNIEMYVADSPQNSTAMKNVIVLVALFVVTQTAVGKDTPRYEDSALCWAFHDSLGFEVNALAIKIDQVYAAIAFDQQIFRNMAGLHLDTIDYNRALYVDFFNTPYQGSGIPPKLVSCGDIEEILTKDMLRLDPLKKSWANFECLINKR